MIKEDEFYNDLLQESYWNGRREAEMRSNINDFLEHKEAEVEVFKEAFEDIYKQANAYGHTVGKEELYEMLKDWV